jgi:hypothetical protein
MYEKVSPNLVGRDIPSALRSTRWHMFLGGARASKVKDYYSRTSANGLHSSNI